MIFFLRWSGRLRSCENWRLGLHCWTRIHGERLRVYQRKTKKQKTAKASMMCHTGVSMEVGRQRGQELSCCERGLRVVKCNTLLLLAVFSKASLACLRAVQMDSQGKVLSVNNDQTPSHVMSAQGVGASHPGWEWAARTNQNKPEENLKTMQPALQTIASPG